VGKCKQVGPISNCMNFHESCGEMEICGSHFQFMNFISGSYGKI
jgi:hypothetical protein